MFAQGLKGTEVFVAMIAARLVIGVVRLLEMVGQDVRSTEVFEAPVTCVSANSTSSPQVMPLERMKYW